MGPQSRAIGPYTLEQRLGAGGMGEGFQAYDRRLDRWVAIKLIRPEAAGSGTARERFLREARAPAPPSHPSIVPIPHIVEILDDRALVLEAGGAGAAPRLSHPSIVQIHDIVESDESDAIVMELVEGEPLARRLARGPLPVDETMRIGREIAEGLAAAHAKGLIHRDLKPENVMVTPEGHAKILDFGLAKRLEGEAEQGLTQDFTVVGTVHTMSPEQARGLPLDARSDLFSLGALLYEMLAGGSPFAAATPLDTLSNVCTLRQRPLRELDPAVPEPLSRLVDQLLEKDSARRPQSAREVAESLGPATASAPSLPLSASVATQFDLPRSGAPPWPAATASSGGGVAALPAPSGPLLSRPYHALGRKGWWLTLLLPLALGLLAAGLWALFWRPAHPRGPLYVAVMRP